MFGFVGILDKKSIDAGILKSMSDTISHSGPDEEGHFIEKNVGLYHKRLSISDLSAG